MTTEPEQDEAESPASDAPLVLSEIQRNNSEAVGLRCPSCGCRHLVATTTVQQFDEAKRYRKCRHCGKRVRTFERIG